MFQEEDREEEIKKVNFQTEIVENSGFTTEPVNMKNYKTSIESNKRSTNQRNMAEMMMQIAANKA